MHPILAFCPYLSLSKPIEFADWRLGPLASFEELWADVKFKAQAEAFLRKFVDNSANTIEKPSVLCRRNGKIDGQPPTPEEQQALELAIGLGFLDRNPRRDSKAGGQGWMVLTADNLDLHFWPIDVEAGNVTVTSGIMVRTIAGGYQIKDKELVIRPPLELHMPISGDGADAERLDAVYRVALTSLGSPGKNPQADRLVVAMGWFIKAWRNTPSIRFPERVVFLKTAFEALTGTSDSREAARRLKAIFEFLPDTHADDAKSLLWSPAETPVHLRTYRIKDPVTGTKQEVQEKLTDLEHWFMAFARARNTIIHDGLVPSLTYAQPGTVYEGHFVWTAEYLFRAAAKASLAALGYPDVWREGAWRAVKRACEDYEKKQRP